MTLADCKNTGEVYENGYQSILLCRDCWQTNYLHENDETMYKIPCMCKKIWKVWIERIRYDLPPSNFLWFKTERKHGIYPMIVSQLESTTPTCGLCQKEYCQEIHTF